MGAFRIKTQIRTQIYRMKTQIKMQTKKAQLDIKSTKSIKKYYQYHITTLTYHQKY